jgi:hypothetical protein
MSTASAPVETAVYTLLPPNYNEPFQPDDYTLREALFRARPTYDDEKGDACYRVYKSERFFVGCRPECGCPRRRHITQAMLDEERERRTDAYIATVQQAADGVTRGTMIASDAITALEALPTLSVRGRMFYRKFTSAQ